MESVKSCTLGKKEDSSIVIGENCENPLMQNETHNMFRWYE